MWFSQMVASNWVKSMIDFWSIIMTIAYFHFFSAYKVDEKSDFGDSYRIYRVCQLVFKQTKLNFQIQGLVIESYGNLLSLKLWWWRSFDLASVCLVQRWSVDRFVYVLWLTDTAEIVGQMSKKQDKNRQKPTKKIIFFVFVLRCPQHFRPIFTFHQFCCEF